ncbi:Laminin subunit beta-4 [Dissostichus eleginoides]|uniref:Laminin subunit beta-4 n=1 Tax=Dissostichus eleginoides TaxID=100907 RepID=A0AAD9ENC2_DISEL|nr:Laminin subunit beta-4 [Dissostichus eleginoides]
MDREAPEQQGEPQAIRPWSRSGSSLQADKVKRLEELLSYRDSGYQQENKRLVDTIMEHEAEISRLNENIEDAERQHKRQMDQIVARHEAEKGNVSDEKDQVTSDSENNDVPLQCDPEIIKLRMRKGETMKELIRKGEELLECVTILEDRNSDLEEKMEAAELQHKEQLDDTLAWYETQQQKLSDQHNEANLVTLNLLQRREEQLLQCEEKFTKSLAENTLTWESEKQQMEMKLKEVEKKKNYQASRNKTLETEFLQMEAQLKRQEEKFSKDLADKSHTWETEKQQMETTLNEVTQEKNDMAKVTLTLETEFKQVVAKLKQVEKEKDRLAENNQSWETDVKQLKEQMREQEEKFSKTWLKTAELGAVCPTQGDGCQAVGKPIGRAEEEALQRPGPEPGELGVQGSFGGDTTETGGGAEGRPGSEKTELGNN